MATLQPIDNGLLNTSSHFQLASPCKSAQNGNSTKSTPQKQQSTPSVPNTGLRNLHISTPQDNNDKKEMEEINETKDDVINSQNAYILIADNKRLAENAKSNPHKTYNRIQVTNTSKLEKELQAMMQSILIKKRKKLQKLDNGKEEKTESDKQEMEEEDNQDKKEEITNENKLEIIEKALYACYQQLIYYNKLFLNPIHNAPVTKIINKQQISADKKQMILKIKKMKSQIDHKRQALMQHIQTLKKLRNNTKNIKINIPQNIKNKMVQNMEYNKDNDNDIDVMDQHKIDKTRQIIAMINNNKKKKMMQLKQKFDALKQNEMRLKKQAQDIEKDEEKLRKFMELKRKVLTMNVVDTDNDTIMSVNNAEENRDYNKNRAISMASSIDSTIHGSVSPLIYDKYQHNELKNKLSFKTLHNMDRKRRNMMEDMDIDI